MGRACSTNGVKWNAHRILVRKPEDAGRSWTTEGSDFEPRWSQECSLFHVVHTGSAIHSISYPMGTGDPSPGVKLPEREADQSPPDSTEVKKMWIYTSTSQ
jgi:hypothetical protein